MSNTINLFTMRYDDRSPERNKELNLCYVKNLNNSKLNTFFLSTQERMKYSDFFKLVNKITKNDDINIICNSDIYFEEDIDKYLNKLKHDECYALSRWNLMENGTIQHFCRQDSQDSWIFRGPIKEVFGDFYLGYRGCDNRIAYELNKAGYKVSNPSKTIKSIHVHVSNVRNYSLQTNEHLVPGPYLMIEPTEL